MKTNYKTAFVAALFAGLMISSSVYGATFIVKDGQPQAEIVISEQPPRMVKLAAEELQAYIEKISGAKLAITNEAGKGSPVKIYVGKSKYTDELKLSAEGLNDGAFKIISGKDWLALIGQDSDFTPLKPFTLSRADAPRMMEEWDKLTGEKWGNPQVAGFKGYNQKMGIWAGDERGSLNAVYEFLRGLGVRWYLPGELGEIVPEMKTIELAASDRLVTPDFPYRDLSISYGAYFIATKEDILWQLRLGLNHKGGFGGGHGIIYAHNREEVKKAHPEYYALWCGNRAIDHKGGCGAPCLSSEGLLQQNVKFARAMFDTYKIPAINVSPADGYGALCECELCKGKSTPERGWNGTLSDYVWNYVNRVAIELYKTHPDRKVTGLAYSSYQLPPEKIDKLSPNVDVVICRWRSNFYDPETREQFRKLTEAWLEKLPSKEIYIWDYYLHNRPGQDNIPAVYPHLIADDLRYLKGKSRGDFIEIYSHRTNEFGYIALALNHLNVYTTARLLWDSGQDIDKMMDEYCTLFYGPAAKEMKEFLAFAEANWPMMRNQVDLIDRVFVLLDKASRAAGKDTVYAQRVRMVADYVQPMKELRVRLTEGRKDVPKAQAGKRDKKDLKLDGRLDDKFWEGLPVYDLKDLVTNKPPVHGTSFQIGCDGETLYFGIKCGEDDMKNLNVTGTKNGDPNIFMGDNLELLLETPTHSYYQVAFNPNGNVMNNDRKKGMNIQWSSGIEAFTHKGDDFWSMEIRVPVAGDKAEDVDPLNGISGNLPTEKQPWFFNLCRQRLRGKDRELSAFSPTGKNAFHVLLKFGELSVR